MKTCKSKWIEAKLQFGQHKFIVKLDISLNIPQIGKELSLSAFIFKNRGDGGGGEKREKRDLHFQILMSIIICKHMKMSFLKFEQNQTTSKNYLVK